MKTAMLLQIWTNPGNIYYNGWSSVRFRLCDDHAADGLVEGTGHFHILIDEKSPAEGEAIPFNDTWVPVAQPCFDLYSLIHCSSHTPNGWDLANSFHPELDFSFHRHKHYGKGQTADDVALTPGKHTLSLVFANAKHESYGPKFSQSVSVVVK